MTISVQNLCNLPTSLPYQNEGPSNEKKTVSLSSPTPLFRKPAPKRKRSEIELNPDRQPEKRSKLYCEENISWENLIFFTKKSSPKLFTQPPPFLYIKPIQIDTFFASLPKIEGSSKDRFNALCKMFTSISTSRVYKANHEIRWEVPYGKVEIKVDVKIEKRLHHSYSRMYTLNTEEFYYISACEEGELNTSFEIRLNSQLEMAEILRLSKRTLPRSVMRSACLRILDYINPSRINLVDDTNLSTTNPPLALRVLLPIANKTPKTLYSPHGFMLDERIHRKDIYENAISQIRATPLLSLPLREEDLVHVNMWKEKYFLKFAETSPSVHELARVIFEQSQECKTPSADLTEFFHRILSIQKNFPNDYNNALKILNNYRHWTKIGSQKPTHTINRDDPNTTAHN